jgi:hypothetical protein
VLSGNADAVLARGGLITIAYSTVTNNSNGLVEEGGQIRSMGNNLIADSDLTDTNTPDIEIITGKQR